jgi:hypothetical protein
MTTVVDVQAQGPRTAAAPSEGQKMTMRKSTVLLSKQVDLVMLAFNDFSHYNEQHISIYAIHAARQ